MLATLQHPTAWQLPDRLMLLELLMFDYRNSDQERYGQQIYHPIVNRVIIAGILLFIRIAAANTRLFSGTPSAKKQADGVKRTMIRDETVIRAGTAQELTEATFPDFQDSDILKASDFFKSLIQRKAADVTQTDI
ncbi:Uncharacterised protein (plasmid) [Citrobacter freundii]|nr:Uncharacterised protein [Citrobacter freundii]